MKSMITPLSLIFALVVVAMTQAWSTSGGLATSGQTPYVHWSDTVPMEPGDTTPKKDKKKKKDRKEREDTSNNPRPDTFRTFKP